METKTSDMNIEILFTCGHSGFYRVPPTFPVHVLDECVRMMGDMPCAKCKEGPCASTRFPKRSWKQQASQLMSRLWRFCYPNS